MRPSILLSFWRVHKCRQPVLEALRPFVEHTRRQGGGRIGWDDPAPLGFLATLITRRAERAVGILDTDALGDLQADLWAALTGLPAEAVGERIVLLSASADAQFAEGSRRAQVFDAAFEASQTAVDAAEAADPPARVADRDSLLDLWDRLLIEAPTA